jgi:hypothetical protein
MQELTPYNDETIQAVVDEIRALNQELQCMQEDYTPADKATKYIAANLLVYYTSIQRNKRCILALL